MNRARERDWHAHAHTQHTESYLTLCHFERFEYYSLLAVSTCLRTHTYTHACASAGSQRKSFLFAYDINVTDSNEWKVAGRQNIPFCPKSNRSRSCPDSAIAGQHGETCNKGSFKHNKCAPDCCRDFCDRFLWGIQYSNCADWCCFYYFISNSPEALLEALYARNRNYNKWIHLSTVAAPTRIRREVRRTCCMAIKLNKRIRFLWQSHLS